jgi:hypothetical protein
MELWLFFFVAFVWNNFIKFNSVLVQDKLQTLVVTHGRSQDPLPQGQEAHRVATRDSGTPTCIAFMA